MKAIVNRLYFIAIILLIHVLCFTGCLSLQPENAADKEFPAANKEEQDKTKADPGAEESGPAEKGKPIIPEPTSGIPGEEEYTNTGMPPNPTIAPLPLNEVLEKIRKSIPVTEQLITKNNNPLYILHDFTQDGVDELCVTGIKSENPENARVEFISDFSRLYANKIEVFPFFLYIYSIDGEEVQRLEKLSLGEQAVYESMTKFALYKEKSDPAVMSISFCTREGSARQWLIFKSPGVKPVSRISLQDTFLSKAMVEDINADGLIDIVLFERGMEEGLGYETFLTWKKWNGKNFVDYKTSNIVRNLNNFLHKIREVSLKGDIKTLISFSFDPGERKKLEKKGLTNQEILFRFLGLPGDFSTGEAPPFNILEDINDIIFPEILDNPFYIRDDKGFYVKFSFRIIYSTGISLIPEVFIYMLKNPFEKQQFVIYPVTRDTVSADD